MKEADIIRYLRTGDDREIDRAFEFLYEDCYPAIRSFVRRKGGGREDAADIFQDALIIFYKKIRNLDFSLQCSIGTYLFSICRNLWLKKMRTTSREAKRKEHYEQDEVDEHMLYLMEGDEDIQTMTACLREMGGDCGQLLIYFFFDGLKTDEVTRKMGYANEQVTRNKKSRCLKKLRILFKERQAKLNY